MFGGLQRVLAAGRKYQNRVRMMGEGGSIGLKRNRKELIFAETRKE